jgi:16S rRNA (cytidine1402-2'-O)-methyltransferase
MKTAKDKGRDLRGTLFVVATPIGNLEDITLRAIRIFKEVDYILCEDTRVTGKLLKQYDIVTKMKRYDAHSSLKTQESIIADLEAGNQIALCSDAGTPGISDPGVHIVDQLLAARGDFKIVSVPGASSITAAFSIAGITGNQFAFLGFIPQKKGRQTFLQELAIASIPTMFLESTHRVMKLFESLCEYCPDKTVVVGRELTKFHEEVFRGTPKEVLEYFTTHKDHQKGEFVVVVY